ncbi:MAG: AAA family ATPase, partial [Gammaproteobacteria bacterium]|nr:AAA family ATPase [Gammaproteobacteria bacterium]
MQSEHSWLGEQAFGDGAGALVNIAYKSHLDALKFMGSVLRDQRGVGLLQGPDASGKTTTARHFAKKLPGDAAIAFVDGTRIKPRELLSRILAQFGYDTGLESTDELLKMVDVFSVQQTRSNQPPVLIVDNADRMFPSALRTLSMLAQIEMQQRFALRIILTGGEGLTALIQSEGMANVAKRSIGIFMMSPLSLREALIYLHARLAACGVNNADTVFPVDVCDRLYEQSSGWPGLMDR